MINILIFGTGSGTEKIMKLFKEDVEVVGFIDNDIRKHNSTFMGKIIVSPTDICNINYDYIVIASMFFLEINKQLISLGIDKKKIVQFYKYGVNEIEHLFNDINQRNIKIIATGLSYMYNALDTKLSREVTIKLAAPSQDLYHDYNIIKHILNMNIYKIEYVIIGLAYYSFHWDISKSSMNYICTKYMRILNYITETKNKEENIEEYNYFLRQSDKLFIEDYNDIVVTQRFNDSWNKTLDEESEKLGEYQAQIHNKKGYEQTVKENIIIIKEYLSLLKNYKIKPILIVCPVSEYYYKHFPKRLKDEFNDIINDISKEYDFQIFDYFYSNKFNDNDFADPSHLNRNGARKFTRMLNENIHW